MERPIPTVDFSIQKTTQDVLKSIKNTDKIIEKEKGETFVASSMGSFLKSKNKKLLLDFIKNVA